jgi:large subunit ribosomal protein L19
MSQQEEQKQEKTDLKGPDVQPDLPEFNSGDTVVVHYRITEGDKTRIQPYEGIVIGKKGEGISKTFIVRRIGADGIGVERIFPLFSPNIEKIDVKKHAKVRRAKLYYLRDKKGREAVRLKERK